MRDTKSGLNRISAKVWCLLPKDWLGRAGKQFRKTITAISDYSEEKIRIREKAEESPELAWKALQGIATEKHAKALRDYAEEEKEKLDSELKRRTLESNERQAKASAEKMETEARMMQISEMDARLSFFDKLRERNAVPIWDDDGNMTFWKAPKDYNWEGLQDRLLRTGELPKLLEGSQSEDRFRS